MSHRNDSSRTPDNSVEQVIKETWAEILEREKFPGLSLPSLSVTPISTINMTPEAAESRETRSILRDSDSSKSAKSVSFRDLNVEALSESETETLTRLLLEKLTSNESLPNADIAEENVLESTEGSVPRDVPRLNLFGSEIQFDIPQEPVRLSAEDLNQLPDMSSSYEGN